MLHHATSTNSARAGHCAPWPDIASLHTPAHPIQARVLSKTVTDYNVRCASFCPFEADSFMTAGRDSMRCYRLAHGGDIRGMSVRRTGEGEGDNTSNLQHCCSGTIVTSKPQSCMGKVKRWVVGHPHS